MIDFIYELERRIAILEKQVKVIAKALDLLLEGRPSRDRLEEVKRELHNWLESKGLIVYSKAEDFPAMEGRR